MNWWVKINTRWTKEQIAPWSSVYKTVYLLFPILSFFLVSDIVDFILWIGFSEAAKYMSESTKSILSANSLTIEAIIYVIGLLVCLLVIKNASMNEIKYVEEHKEKDNKLTPLTWVLLVIASLGLAIGLNYLLSLVGIKEMSSSYSNVSESQYGVAFGVGLLVYCVVSPVVEEVVFRGILFNRLKRTFPLVIAYVAGSLMFGLFHWNLVQGIYGTLMGLFIIWVYDRYETILAPIVVHMIANIGVYVLTYKI